MSKNYDMMMSYKDAISWMESLPDDGKKSQVLNRMRYEKDKSDPVKPKFLRENTSETGTFAATVEGEKWM